MNGEACRWFFLSNDTRACLGRSELSSDVLKRADSSCLSFMIQRVIDHEFNQTGEATTSEGCATVKKLCER